MSWLLPISGARLGTPKPRLSLYPYAHTGTSRWKCNGLGLIGYGATPAEAYAAWDAAFFPHAQVARAAVARTTIHCGECFAILTSQTEMGERHAPYCSRRQRTLGVN